MSRRHGIEPSHSGGRHDERSDGRSDGRALAAGSDASGQCGEISLHGVFCSTVEVPRSSQKLRGLFAAAWLKPMKNGSYYVLTP